MATDIAPAKEDAPMYVAQEHHLITFKYNNGRFQKSHTIPFMGKLSEFVVSRIDLGGPMPVILYTLPITKDEFDKIWHYYIENKVYNRTK